MLDFFAQARRARQQSQRLLLAFVGLLAMVVLLFCLLLWLIWQWFDPYPLPHFWQRPFNGFWVLFILSSVLCPAWLAWRRFRRGGFDLALQLRARCPDDLESAAARTFIAVAEEMAIASGSPMPSLWVLTGEPAINAFVMGHDQNDVGLFVTQGALDQLSRDELQAVVAHEFGHIANGDLMVNFWLLVWLSGLAGPSSLAKRVLTGQGLGAKAKGPSLPAGRHYLMQDARTSHAQGRGAALVYGLALVVYLLGSLALLAGKCLRAAFSRQREYWADARAVQFARLNHGLASALWKAQNQPVNQQFMKTPMAELLQHLAMVPTLAEGWLATHPPLEARIQRLGSGLLKSLQQQDAESVDQALARQERAIQQGGIPTDVLWQLPENAVALAVSTQVLALAHARQVRQALPPLLLSATRETQSALGLVAGLYLQAQGVQASAFALVQLEQCQPQASAWLAKHSPLFTALFVGARLPLLELSLPSLQRLPEPGQRQWLQCLTELDLGEPAPMPLARQEAWWVLAYVQRHLWPWQQSAGQQSLAQLRSPIWLLLSYLAEPSKALSGPLWPALKDEFSLPQSQPCPPAQMTPQLLTAGLNKLAELHPHAKPQLLEACARILAQDGRLDVQEYERLRLVADYLGASLPMLQP